MQAKNFLKEEFNLVKALFSDFDVTFTNRGNIRIKLPDVEGTWYVLGLNKYGFWVRRHHLSDWWGKLNLRQMNVTRLNMKRDENGNYKYTFDTFDELLNYFGNLTYNNKLSFE